MKKKLLRALITVAIVIGVLAILAGFFILLCEWPVYQEI